MELSQTQLTTIILAGMMSQYPVAVFVGSLIDQYGPSWCSLIAALLFSSGFGGFALEVANALDSLSKPSQAVFLRLVFYFLLVGLGTVFSYCSSLFAASKFFPNHIGLASGSSMALFGLSPLFLSTVATSFFTDATTGIVNVPSFTFFLASLTSLVYFFGFISLRLVSWPSIQPPIQVRSTQGEETMPQETSPLLASQETESDSRHILGPTIGELLRKPDFWLLAIFCIFILGVSEMIISNIGTIVISLPPASAMSAPGGLNSGSSTAFQVKLISVANTLSRIIVGPFADFISPVGAYQPQGVSVFPRKHVISRFSFLSGAATLLICTLLWMKIVVYTQSQLWALSLGTGLSYSTVFTVLPSLISSLWGMRHLGRNFGIMMYAPFTGTPLFSYFYALISASHTQGSAGICKGQPCWDSTFSLAIVTSIIALLLSIILWKRWRGRI
ncbi:hypothetical protein GALMADRAFT_239491 [Galerina marginata CBS 339.88]|uniref:Nodulin-like domain-containing protein n=1 Tax=Galerina marginata (strain CBS 339.88) TaxID=685588 RepID=A0A067TE80_GALM3|nr:hypothetical protein GALMADRAFT_239491 [Galerina marginata CBS 339.88]